MEVSAPIKKSLRNLDQKYLLAVEEEKKLRRISQKSKNENFGKSRTGYQGIKNRLNQHE